MNASSGSNILSEQSVLWKNRFRTKQKEIHKYKPRIDSSSSRSIAGTFSNSAQSGFAICKMSMHPSNVPTLATCASMAHRNFLKFSSARNKEVTSVLVQYQYQYQYNYSIIYSNSSNILTLRKTLWKNSTVKVTFTSGSPSFARCIAVAFFFASLFSLE